MLARFVRGEAELAGLFSLRGAPVRMKCELEDGAYENLLTGERVEVKGGEIATEGEPLWLRVRGA